MDFDEVKNKFIEFENKYGSKAFLKVNEFFGGLKEVYLNKKTKEFLAKGFNTNESHNKARQSWRPTVGKLLEDLIKYMIEEFCQKYDINVTSDKQLKKSGLSRELDLVRRMIEIHFDDYSLIPDADIILYKKKNKDIKVLAILSLKTSFRERFTETPYWKLKLKENPNTKDISVFMITPDNTDEISYIHNNSPRKGRIILEYELDGIYLAREEFDSSKKVKSLQDLFEDLRRLM